LLVNFIQSLERIIEHKILGTVTLRKVRRSRSLKISVRSKKVLVTLPFSSSFKDALAFLQQRESWVQNALLKENRRQTKFTPETDFGTYSRKVQLIPDNRQNVWVKVGNEVVEIYYPSSRDINDTVLQEVIRKAIEHAWKVEAHEVLPARIKALAEQHGLNYKRLSIRSSQTRWGSCSFDNSINLSIHLMHLPDHLIDYVILHELCHTRHKNHGPAFWAYLNEMTGGKARIYDRQMKMHSTRVY
jgi:predicted metal-dependent hydrolase